MPINYEMYQLIISSIDTNNITPEMGSKYICWLLNRDKPSYGNQSDKAYKRMPDSTNIISIMKNLAKLGAEPDSEMLYISTSTSVQQPDEVIGFLLDWNVGIDFEDDHTTHQILKPFNFAASYCGDNILKKFLLAGAEINPDDRIQSPLMFAIEDSNLSAVKFLLENGANPNCRNFNEYEQIYGTSALHMAINETIMGGMSCGDVSTVAWEILKDSSNYSLTITDDEVSMVVAMLASAKLSDEKIIAGECAVPGIIALIGLFKNKKYLNKLGLNQNSKVLLFGCEGLTDSTMYKKLLNDGL